MTTEKKYKNIEDVLDFGEHTIKVSPKPEFDPASGGQKKGTHKQGVSAKGFKWYMYSTKIGNDWINLFANDKNKDIFDSGEIEVNIVKKFDPNTGEPIKKVYFNPVGGKSLQEFAHEQNVKKDVEEFRKDIGYKTKEEAGDDVASLLASGGKDVPDEEIEISDLPF